MIQQLDKITPIGGAQRPAETQTPADGNYDFFSIFQSAIDNVVQTDMEKSALEYQLSVGELDNPALLTIASTKNQIAVELLVQLRNKALDAYTEITRISL